MMLPMSAPDPERALKLYRARARMYDGRFSSRVANVRDEAVSLLNLRRGQTVLEMGCGTGKNFALLRARVGAEGRIIGIDQSPDMLAQARRKADDQGWRNVELVHARADSIDLRAVADAVLFYATHDILRSPEAIARALGAARPGAPIVAAGTQWASGWNVPVNLYLWVTSRRYITTFEGYARPWDRLAAAVPNLTVSTQRMGAIYLAHGTVPGDERT